MNVRVRITCMHEVAAEFIRNDLLAAALSLYCTSKQQGVAASSCSCRAFRFPFPRAGCSNKRQNRWLLCWVGSSVRPF